MLANFVGTFFLFKRRFKKMIFTLERRTESGGGTVSTHYEVRSYSHISPIGVLMNGKTLKKGSKAQCEKYCRLKGLSADITEL